MVNRRRGIHPETLGQEEKNKQVGKPCSKCEVLVFFEEKIEHEQFENKPAINLVERRKSSVNFDDIQVFCDACRSNATNETSGTVLFGKLTAIDFKWLPVVVTVMCAILYVGSKFVYNYMYAEKTFDVRVYNQTQDEIQFDDELYGLEDKYKMQEERVWYTFAAGIKSVIAENPNKPSVFLLLYDNDGAENTVKCIAQEVTRIALKYLMKREITPLLYAGNEFNSESILEDPGRLLELYKDPVKRNGAMIVTNLEDIKPKVAANFHFFCDRYSPLVEKAIYMFTLKLKQDSKAPLQKLAEDTLQNLWAQDLPGHKLQPLITRMTGNVIKISKDYVNCRL